MEQRHVLSRAWGGAERDDERADGHLRHAGRLEPQAPASNERDEHDQRDRPAIRAQEAIGRDRDEDAEDDAEDALDALPY